MLHYIVKPAFESLAFTRVERIDESDIPGQITVSIFRKIMEADWVVADLSGLNANVFYEVGVRHVIGKPMIHLSTDIDSIPFDNKNQNTISYIHDDPQSHQDAIRRIKLQVEHVEADPKSFSNPFTIASGQMKLTASQSTSEQLLATALDKIAALEAQQRKDSAVLQGLQPRIAMSGNALTGYAPGAFTGHSLRSLGSDPRVAGVLGSLSDEDLRKFGLLPVAMGASPQTDD